MLFALFFLCFVVFVNAEYTCTANPSKGLTISVVCVNDGGADSKPETVSCLTSKQIKSATGAGPFCGVQQNKNTLQLNLAGGVNSPKWACATTLEFVEPSATVVCQ
jgi:hypothetical protein